MEINLYILPKSKIFNKHYMMKGFTFCYFKDKIVMVMENGI